MKLHPHQLTILGFDALDQPIRTTGADVEILANIAQCLQVIAVHTPLPSRQTFQ